MTITVGASTPPGTYPITVTGNGGGVQQNTTVTLTVTLAASFTLSASPGSVTIAQGSQGGSTITSTISGGFNAAITLSATGTPSGTTVSLQPQPHPSTRLGQFDDDDHGRCEHAARDVPDHGDRQRGRRPTKHHRYADCDARGELYAFSVAGLGNDRARQSRWIDHHLHHQRWIQRSHYAVRNRSAVRHDRLLQPEPHSGTRLGQFGDDHHGRCEHADWDVPDHRDRQWRRRSAEHDGHAERNLIRLGELVSTSATRKIMSPILQATPTSWPAPRIPPTSMARTLVGRTWLLCRHATAAPRSIRG